MKSYFVEPTKSVARTVIKNLERAHTNFLEVRQNKVLKDVDPIFAAEYFSKCRSENVSRSTTVYCECIIERVRRILFQIRRILFSKQYFIL